MSVAPRAPLAPPGQLKESRVRASGAIREAPKDWDEAARAGLQQFRGAFLNSAAPAGATSYSLSALLPGQTTIGGST